MSDYHVKKIILPSGKAVQIVYFHPEDALTPQPAAEIAPSPSPFRTPATGSSTAPRVPATWSTRWTGARPRASAGT